MTNISIIKAHSDSIRWFNFTGQKGHCFQGTLSGKRGWGYLDSGEAGSFLKNWLYLVPHLTLEWASVPMTHAVTRIFSATSQRPSRRFGASTALPSHLSLTSIQIYDVTAASLVPLFSIPSSYFGRSDSSLEFYNDLILILWPSLASQRHRHRLPFIFCPCWSLFSLDFKTPRVEYRINI